MNILRNMQVVMLFDEATSTNWTFQIEWLTRQISVFREQRPFAVFEQCSFPPTQEYLESLTKTENTKVKQ